MTDIHNYKADIESLAKETGINLYQRFTTESASDILGISIPTLNRIKARGEIAYLRLGDRTVRYFGFQILEYLLKSIEEVTCQNTPQKTATKSATTGSDNERKTEPQLGIACGGTKKLDAAAALASGLAVLRKPSPD